MRIPNRKNIFIGSQLKNRWMLVPITAVVGRASHAGKDGKRKRDTKSFRGSTYFHSKHLASARRPRRYDREEAGFLPAGTAPQSSEKPAAPPALGRAITGGLVVPLYVIVLALVGGAISMTRRVPEYQRRALDSRDPLTNAEAREYLVFQIMQVITAPLIAVTAYYVYHPGTPVESVVLGFASGFASEPILLMIRALVDKLTPAQAPQAS